MSRSSVYVPDLDSVAWKPLSEVTPDYPQASLDALDAEAKLLNEDPDTGAFTMVVKLPAGAGEPTRGSHSCDQETFLLEGDLTIDGETFSAPAYWHFPAGTIQFLLEGSVNETGKDRQPLAYWCHPPGEVHGKSFTNEEGCTSLLFFDGPWEVTVVEDA